MAQRRYGNRASQQAMRFPQIVLFPWMTRLDRHFANRRVARRSRWGCCHSCGGMDLHRPSCEIGYIGQPLASWQLIGPENDALRARGLIT